MEIRCLTEMDMNSFWKLRLIALKEDVIAFGASYEEEIQLSQDVQRQKYLSYIGPKKSQFVLGAYNEKSELIGMVGFRREQRIRLKHKASVWGFFVLPEYRGKGTGNKLLSTLIDIVKSYDGLETLLLAVVSDNHQANRLYTSLGFITYGVEPKALKVNEIDYDENLMVLNLK